MKRFLQWITIFVPLFFSVQLAAPAQAPRFINAKEQTLNAAPDFQQQFRSLVERQPGPAWIGYAETKIEGHGLMCCFEPVEQASHSSCGRCRLEGPRKGIEIESDSPTSTTAKLESPELFWVLFRISGRKVEKIRVFSQECELDAGGLPVIWMERVPPGESIRLLAGYVTIAGDEAEWHRRLSHEALAAIALHRDVAANEMLNRFVEVTQPAALRKETLFWLGSARGEKGYEALKRVVKTDPSEDVRARAMFALSVSKAPQALETMIDAAHHDASAKVRSQALFWLAQKAGQKAVGAISAAIEQDPETEVKRRAVFALSLLPKDEGVPKLIEVARTNRNPIVRKQALFWLGQSNDPRALRFVEEILTH